MFYTNPSKSYYLLGVFYLMEKYSKEFLKDTIQIWQPYTPIPLSLKDAREIIKNMTALFNFLIAKEKNVIEKIK